MRVVDCPKLGPLQIYQSLKLICTKIQIKQKKYLSFFKIFSYKELFQRSKKSNLQVKCCLFHLHQQHYQQHHYHHRQYEIYLVVDELRQMRID